MNLLRLADVDVRGKRVFIRADLNVPQDDAGTDHRRHAHPRIVARHRGCPVARRRGDGDIAPRPPRRRQADRRRLAGADRRTARRVAGPRGPPDSRLGERRHVAQRARLRRPGACSRTAASTRARKRTGRARAADGAALRRLRATTRSARRIAPEATTHGMARYAPIACAGPLLAAELEALGRALGKPQRPLVAIVAGAKVSTKLTILRALLAQGR